MNRLLGRWSAAGLLEWVSWITLVVVTVSLPAVYFVIELQFQRGSLANMAGSHAWTVTQRIAGNPKLWRFEEHRLQELVGRVMVPGEASDRRSVVLADGTVVVESRPLQQLQRPVLAEQAPLHDAGRTVGWLQVERSMRPLVWRTAWLALASAAAAALVIVLLKRLPLRALRRVEAELRHKAFHDDLTGLYNRDAFRRLLDAAVARAASGKRSLAVMFVDLDRFKAVNDTFGHDAGDEVLKAVAQRLSAAVRATDTVARLSGDEFAVLVDTGGADVDAEALADSLLARFEAPFPVHGRDWHLTCSVGLSRYPHHATESDKLLAFADTAMLHAKSTGRSARSVYSQDMQRGVERRLQLEADLRDALPGRQFELHYQPLLDLASGRLDGVEALLRWRHPARGLVAPGEFIACLEDMGLIHAVGQWVLIEACSQMRRWLDDGRGLRQVAINVSALQFERGAAFVDLVRRALAEAQLPARHLQLEMTEGVLMSDSEHSLAVLGELHQLGVSLAVDDFGTGYSSLAYLRRFPVDTLKVDRSFVRDMCRDAKDASIVQAIVKMAHSLDLSVTAEGIENADQLAALTALGCDTGQGYLLGRPAAATAIDARQRDTYAVG